MSWLNRACSSGDLVFFLFDLLHLDGVDTRPLPLVERKERLQALLSDANDRLRYSDRVSLSAVGETGEAPIAG